MALLPMPRSCRFVPWPDVPKLSQSRSDFLSIAAKKRRRANDGLVRYWLAFREAVRQVAIVQLRQGFPVLMFREVAAHVCLLAASCQLL